MEGQKHNTVDQTSTSKNDMLNELKDTLSLYMQYVCNTPTVLETRKESHS